MQENISTQESNFLKLLLRGIGWTFFFLATFFMLTAFVLGIIAWRKVNAFSQNAHVSLSDLIQVARTGWNTPPVATDNAVNFLILGTDNLDNRGHAVALTDTMLLASIHLHTGRINLFSIPRDLWIPDYQTKINALYTYGQDRYPGEPQRFPREVLESTLNIKIHHTVILSLPILAQLVDVVGGVDVPVKEGFVDPLFPREDVDVTKEHDPAKLYKTVEFKTGVEHMSGDRVLEYVRSRHSLGDQGSDNARALRQQDVVFALLTTLKNPKYYLDTARAGKLYAFYNDHFAQYVPLVQLVGIGKALFPYRNNLGFTVGSPAVYPADQNGTIYHPPLLPKYQKQWVYEVKDPGKFRADVRQKLGL